MERKLQKKKTINFWPQFQFSRESVSFVISFDLVVQCECDLLLDQFYAIIQNVRLGYIVSVYK